MNISRILFWTRIFFVYVALVIFSSGMFLLYYAFFKMNGGTTFRLFFLLPVLVNLALAVLFIAPVFLKRSQGTWTYTVVLLFFSLLGCYAYPFNIILLIYWNKKEFKEGFIKESTDVA